MGCYNYCMTFIHAIILGIVEGLTEFLPISSTGHLILTSRALSLEPTEFLKSFEIVIQFGAILAVLVYYSRVLFLKKELLWKVIVAFIPTGIVGFFLYKIVKMYLLGNLWVVVVALVVGGIILIFIEKRLATQAPIDVNSTRISYKQAAIVGLFQSLAIVPGVSRAAATIIGGRALGIQRRQIVEFSFLLAIPTIGAAALLDVIKNPEVFYVGNRTLLIIGLIVSFITAFSAIFWFIRYVEHHSLVAFGIYRIIVAVVFYFFFLY